MYGTNKPSYEMGSFNPMFSSTYQPSQSTSIALFHIPADSTNSLYVDGVPSDATEREVSRNSLIIQISSVLFQGSNACGSFAKLQSQADNFYCAL